jgi:pimeloyl-ACP methyl ester carboxylesterase
LESRQAHSVALSSGIWQVPPGIEERFASVNGVRVRFLHASSAQNARPLILIHGLLGFSFSWRHNILPLSRVADVYAPDLPGVGFSERPKKFDCSFAGVAQFVLSFMDELGLRDADICGTSHGGAVAMVMASLDKDTGRQRVRRLILVAPVNPWSRTRRWLIPAIASRPGMLAMRAAAPLLLKRTYWYFLRRVYGNPQRIVAGTAETYAEPLGVAGTTDHLLRVIGCWERDLRSLETVLPQIADTRTLLMWGSRDIAVAPASARELTIYLHRAEVVIIQGSGHLPYEETPEEFNAAVARFLPEKE